MKRGKSRLWFLAADESEQVTILLRSSSFVRRFCNMHQSSRCIRQFTRRDREHRRLFPRLQAKLSSCRRVHCRQIQHHPEHRSCYGVILTSRNRRLNSRVRRWVVECGKV